MWDKKMRYMRISINVKFDEVMKELRYWICIQMWLKIMEGLECEYK